ncbi:MAG: HAD hydrolase-like protein [Sulfuricellaceae bacterium]|nr:HAD hydrolase-like protein [Sulfuricellaceae bacterium]
MGKWSCRAGLTGRNQIFTLVFDLDGTLIDSAPSILDAFAAALHEAGIAAHVPLDSNLIGPPLAETLTRISGSKDAALVRVLAENFKRHYDTAGVISTGAYPGVDEMLDRFAAAGAAMHICTNKRLSVSRAILEHLGWKDRFVSVYALDMVEPRLDGKADLLAKQLDEQKLAPAHVRYIGDKREDGAAADANNLAFYYASWGYGDLVRGKLDTGWKWLSQPSDFL